jgi:hypothetical protein
VDIEVAEFFADGLVHPPFDGTLDLVGVRRPQPPGFKFDNDLHRHAFRGFTLASSMSNSVNGPPYLWFASATRNASSWLRARAVVVTRTGPIRPGPV